MEVGSRISVPQTEIQKYYDEHKADFVRQEEVFLREILISSEGKDAAGVAAVEKKAKAIVERARKGEKFPELARDNSDADSKQRMGEIGWFKRSDLNPQLADVVFKQRKGYVTDAIRLPNGFLILRVEDRHEAGQAAIEDVRDEIMEKLYVPRMEPAVRTFLTKLREDAFLEIRAGYVDSGAAPGKDTAWKDPAQLKPETTTKKAVEMRRKKKLLWTVPLPGKPKVVQTTG
jgi:parvulin-like peptidyl-prolyl isomerase